MATRRPPPYLPAAAPAPAPAPTADAGDGGDDFLLGAKKKKKKKKKTFDIDAAEAEQDAAAMAVEVEVANEADAMLEAAAPQVAVEELGELALELAFPLKKKRKRTEKIPEEYAENAGFLMVEEEVEVKALSKDEDTAAWAGSNRDYHYTELLERVFDIMRAKNPNMLQGEKRRFVMKPPSVIRVGSRKSGEHNGPRPPAVRPPAPGGNPFASTPLPPSRFPPTDPIVVRPRLAHPRTLSCLYLEMALAIRCGRPLCLYPGFINFVEICKMMHRQPDHVLGFLLTELGTSGTLDGSNSLILKGRFQQKQMESVLRRYIRELAPALRLPACGCCPPPPFRGRLCANDPKKKFES